MCLFENIYITRLNRQIRLSCLLKKYAIYSLAIIIPFCSKYLNVIHINCVQPSQVMAWTTMESHNSRHVVCFQKTKGRH